MAAIPFGRWLGVGKVGKDVLAVKRALARAGFGPGKLRILTPVFGPFTRIFLKRFEHKHGLSVDGVYGPADHAALTPFFDAYSRSLYMSVSVYVNPLKKATGISLQRTDQGVDFFADTGSPILAMGRAKITRSATDSGWPGGGCVQYVLTDGDHAGEEIYVAEFIKPVVSVGQLVQPGQKVAYFTRSAADGVGIETGYIRKGTDTPCSTDTSGAPTDGGLAFARFLRRLGQMTLQDPGPGSDRSPC